MTKRYEIYKDSGVQWLGEIPEHWSVSRIKHTIKSSVVGSWGEDEKKDGSDIICLRVADFNYNNGTIKTDNLTYRNYGDKLCPEKLFQAGDLLLEKSGGGDVYPVGRVVRYTLDNSIVTCSNFIQKLTPKDNVVPDLLYYLFATIYARKLNGLFFNQTTGIQNLKVVDYLNQLIPLPPLSEQHSIVTYLDDKCAKIDKSIENMEKQIALLQEMKQRVIADAVTRGVDKTVKMKKSRIAWLDEVPEHWDCVKLKAFCKENKTINKNGEETCVLSLSYGRIIIKQDINFGLIPDNYNSYQIVEPGYIILRLTDLQNDHRSLRTGLVKDRGIITSAYVGLIVCGMDSEYVHRLLHTYDVLKVFYGMGGGLRQSMNYQDVVNLYIPVPPIEEQRAIVSYINERTTKIETLAKKIEQEIVYLKEYKHRLISDVVTGQVKVC